MRPYLDYNLFSFFFSYPHNDALGLILIPGNVDRVTDSSRYKFFSGLV